MSNFFITTNDVQEVYDKLKDKYELTLTTTFALNRGFTEDCPIIVGKAHGQIITLYEGGGVFILDVKNENQTRNIHWHPDNVEGAISDIVEFMEGKSNYKMRRTKSKFALKIEKIIFDVLFR